MKQIKLASLLLLVITALSQLNAQSVVENDSIHLDSIHSAAEQLMLDEFKQRQFDSIVRMNLEKEIREAVGNTRKTNELEHKLKLLEQRDSLRNAKQLVQLEGLKKTAKGFPVAPFGDTLFYVYTKIGAFSARDRAKAISERIINIYEDPFFNEDSFSVIESFGSSYDILYNRQIQVLTISSVDALWMESNGLDLAVSYQKIVQEAIVKQKEANSVLNWLKKLGLVAIVLLGVGLLVRLIYFLFARLKLFLSRQHDQFFRSVSISGIKLLNHFQFKGFTFRFLSVLRLFTVLFTVYLSLPILFSIFPETEDLTTKMLGWIMSPIKAAVMGVIHFIPNLITIVVIYLIFRYSIKAIRYFVNEIESGGINISGFHPDWAMPTFNIIRFLLYAFMFVLIFPYLPGAHSVAFQGVSVFLGLLLSLGSSSAISNIIAGIVITYMRPFKIGDRIKIGDTVGDVLEKNLLVTRIRTVKNEEITIPNSSILIGNTINYSTLARAEKSGLILHTTVTIGYDVPWKLMHETLIKAALRTHNVLKEPLPFVLQTGLEDFYVSYQLNVYTREASHQSHIYSELHQNIQDCCFEAGIEIMSPHYRAERDGSPVAIPPAYLNKEKEN